MGTVYTKHSDYIIRKDGLFIQYKEPVILNNNVLLNKTNKKLYSRTRNMKLQMMKSHRTHLVPGPYSAPIFALDTI